jgi:large subunit ribosomal protein L21
MFAVIEFGGKQYLVTEGQRFTTEKTGKKPGSSVVFDKVMLTIDGTKVSIGQPYVKGATVTAALEREYRDEKVTVLKYKPKVRYRKKYGHRQTVSDLKVTAIKA